MKKTLHLTLKKHWFDLILSGEKTVEYRDKKPYWIKRLKGKRYDQIIFTNGYGKDKPQMTVEFINQTSAGLAKPQNGEVVNYADYALCLGDILEAENLSEDQSILWANNPFKKAKEKGK